MSRKNRADWIDRRLRRTTTLGEASALVANDIVANQPGCEDAITLVIEVGGGHVWDVYSNRPLAVKLILIDHDETEPNPGDGARRMQVSPLTELGAEAKAIMIDAGIALHRT